MEDLDKLKKLIVTFFNTSETVIFDEISEEDITLQTNLYSFPIDSLDFVELIMKIESEFNLKTNDIAAMKISTVEDLLVYIRDNKQE